MHDFPFRFPLDLEVGFGVVEGFVCPGEDLEEFAGVDLFAGVFEVFLVVSHEEEFAVGGESGFDGLEERDLDEAAAMMFELRPRIWAEEVDAGNGCFG